jgi:hypothetical protein
MNAAQRAIRGAWAHLIIPIKPDDGQTGPSRGYALHAAPIQNSGGEKTVAEAAYDMTRPSAKVRWPRSSARRS